MQRWSRFNGARRRAFLRALAETGNVTRSAKLAEVAPRTVYWHRERDPEFAAECDEAVAEGLDLADQELYRRGVHGWEEPVFRGEKQVGTIRRYSDRCLIFLLKAGCPEKSWFRPVEETNDVGIAAQLEAAQKRLAAERSAAQGN